MSDSLVILSFIGTLLATWLSCGEADILCRAGDDEVASTNPFAAILFASDAIGIVITDIIVNREVTQQMFRLGQ